MASSLAPPVPSRHDLQGHGLGGEAATFGRLSGGGRTWAVAQAVVVGALALLQARSLRSTY